MVCLRLILWPFLHVIIAATIIAILKLILLSTYYVSGTYDGVSLINHMLKKRTLRYRNFK